jgi:murein DD-endopeptidase MepM/ murein hydrolase activator NlpD
MASLTGKYKKIETALWKRVSARVVAVASRASSFLKRAKRACSQGLTVLVVEDSAKPPKGVTISYLGLGLGCAGLASLLALTIVFSFGAHSEGLKAEDSGGELGAARAELDQYREGANKLADAYVSLSKPLSELAASVQKPKATKSLFAPLLSASGAAAGKVSRLRGEAKGIAEASAGLEAAIAPIEELGDAVASMDAIKQTVPALWPLKDSIGHLSATYGPNPDPFTGVPYFHKGIDCSNYREGDLIVATAEGTVVFAGVQGGYGRSVVISHPNGYFTRYGHMQRILVRDGQKVTQGQTIGVVGNTGHTTGPHTHYEVWMGNELVDPIDYLWSKNDRKAPEGTIPFGTE